MTPADLERYRELKREAEREFRWLNDGVATDRPYTSTELEFLESDIACFERTHPDIRPLTAPVDYVVRDDRGSSWLRRSEEWYWLREMKRFGDKLTEAAHGARHPSNVELEYRRRLRSAAAILLAKWNGWDVKRIRRDE